MLEYDGAPFCGWQKQDPAHEVARKPSVQRTLENAIHAFTGEVAELTVAGRTDAGVHARGQVAHLDLAYSTSPIEIIGAINHHLGAWPIAVLDVAEAAPDFDARRSATARHYEYRIINRRGKLALDAGRAWQIPLTVAGPLDADAMHTAAQLLLGRHDFSTFRDAECQANSPIRTLDYLNARRDGELISITAGARSFLHHQVRNMLGTLALVGRGKWTIDQFAAAFQAADRRAGGPTCPADGLTLLRVDY